MKQMRRYLAVLLALTMVLGMLPAAVAEEAAEAPVVLMEELPEIEVADDQELLAYLEDSEAQRLLIRDEMTLTLARNLVSNDEVYWAENGVLHVEGAVLTCAAIDMMAFDAGEFADAMGEAPFCNMDAPHRNIWVFEGVDLAGVELPANRTLSWVAPLVETTVITGQWPVLQTLFVPEGAGLTVQTDLTVENAAIVNGALFLENSAKLTANMISGTGSCWWTVNETVNCENIEHVIYPHGNEYTADNGALCVDVYDVPSLKYYLTDGIAQEVNVSADLRLPVDTNIVSNDGLYANFRYEDDETGRRGNLYRLEVLGEGTLTVAGLGLAVWEQAQLDAAIAGNYPIQVSEGGHTNLFLEGEFRIDETTVLPSMTSLLFGAHGTLTLAEGVRLTSEAGLWNINYEEDLADLNKGLSLKHNALIDAVYYNPQTEASIRVYYMSEQDFLTDWAAKKEAYPLLETVLISTDVDGVPGRFDLTGDWTVGELREIVVQDGTTLNIKSTAKVTANALYIYNPQDTDACLLTVESKAVRLGYLNVEASAYWPADVKIFFDSADIRYFAPMLFFRGLGWDEERQVHVDDPECGAYSEWPLRISPVQEKVGYVAYCYPKDPEAGAPANIDGWEMGPLAAEKMGMTKNIEAELLEEELRDEETVPWESYRFRTNAWSSNAELGISYQAGGYELPLFVASELETIGFFTAPTRSEENAVGQLNCDTFGSTQEAYYLIFRPEYDGQYVDRVEVLGGEAAVTATEDSNVWKVTVTGTESFNLDLCLYVADEYSEPWEWHHGIWVECGTNDREIVEVTTADQVLSYLKNGSSEQLAAMNDIEIELTDDISSTDYVGSYFDNNGKFYRNRFVGEGTLTVAEYEAVVNNETDWADIVAGMANVDADRLYVLVNDAVQVEESLALGDKELYLTATADLQLAPGVMISSYNTYWNLDYEAMDNRPDLNKDLCLKHNAFADAIFCTEDGEHAIRVIYADEETFLNDLPGKLAEYPNLKLLILSTDDGKGNYGSVVIDEDWAVLNDHLYSLTVQDGTTLTISTDLEIGELWVEDADDENTRTGVVAVNVTGDTNLTVHENTYIEGDFAFGSGKIELNGDVHITGNQPGLIAMWLGWDDNDKLVEDENTTAYLDRILPVDEHPMMFFVSTYENGQWVKKPVSVNADGVEIKSLADQAAAGQDNGAYFVSVRAQDWSCEYEFTAVLDGVTYTMCGDSHPNEVEFFSDPWDNYDTFLNGVQLSPVNDNVFYAVVTNGDLQWSNVALPEDIAEYATIEDTEDGNVKKITISAENARQMLIDGNHGVDVVVTYDAKYSEEEEPQPHDAGIWTWVENGMVFVPDGEVPEDTLEFPGKSEYMNHNQPDLHLAPKETVTGVLYYVWYNDQTGKWMANAYSGNCLWQEGDSASVEPELDHEGNETGRTVITGVHGGETYIHHTGFDENGNPNEGGIWHGVPFPVHVGKGADVTSEAGLKAAQADETVTDIHVDTEFEVSKDLFVDKPVHFGENGHISVTGNVVLTLVEPNFWDCAEDSVDYWLMFTDYPSDVRTHYLCGNHDAAKRQAAKYEGGSVTGMHTDRLPSNGDTERSITFDGTWPAITVDDSFVHPGNVYEVNGAKLTFGRLYSTVENFDETMNPNEMPTPLQVNSGSVTITGELNIDGNVYWAPGASVTWTEDYHISGQYPHLAYRWLDNWGQGWFENMESQLEPGFTMAQPDDRWMIFYATVPVWEGDAITWSTAPVTVSDGLEDGSAVTLVEDVEDQPIREDQENAEYFVRIKPESYDWNDVLPLTATVGAYTLTMNGEIVLPEVGYFSQPEYAEEYYLTEVRLSENPDENVFYLIVHTPENAGYWMHHYEFHDGADRIHAEDLGNGIIKIALQDGVDIYEDFHLHAEVFWQDQENMWTRGCGIGVNGAMNTAPYLSQTWLADWGEGWFVSDDAMNNQGRDFQTAWFDEQWRTFFLNRYDAERETWITTPVEVTVDENAPVDLIHMTDSEKYPKAPGANFPGYYYRVVPHENVWGEEVVFTYAMGDGTVLELPMYIGRSELGFYSDAKICNENYITRYALNPGGENIFYLGIDIPTNEDGSSAYGVSDVWAVENKWANMVKSVNYLSDRLWQIELSEAAARVLESFDLEFEVQIDFGDRQDVWSTGIHCSAGDVVGKAAASIIVNEKGYFFYEGTDAILMEYCEYDENGNEIWKQEWVDSIQEQGVSYDWRSNHLTLNGAELENLYLRYSNTWIDDEGNEYTDKWMPDPNVTIEVQGENSISNNYSSALGVVHGTRATLVGEGVLNLVAENSGDNHYGNPAIALWGGGSLTITDSVTVHAETEDYGMERDENGNPIDENGVFGVMAIQGDYDLRSSLTVAGEANLTLTGTRGGMESVSTVTFKDSAEVTSQEIVINGDPSLRPSMTVTGDAEVTVKAVRRDRYEHALHFLDGGRLYMKGGTLTVDNTALTRPECALGFASNMGSLKGGLQISGGVLNVTAAGGTGIGLSTGNSYQQSGGTVMVTVGADNPEYWGSWGMTTDPRTEFVMTGGEATFIGTQSDDINSAGILYRSNDGTIAGGSLNAYGVHRKHEERNLISGLYISMGSLSITGGTHSFKVIDSNGNDDFTVRGVGLIVHESGYLAFTGGSTRTAGYCAAWSIGPDNHITLGKNIHAVSEASGNELNMVYYDDGATDQIHWFEEDNLVTYPEGDGDYDESQLSHDVTISGTKGNAVVNAAGVDITVTNGAPALGAKMSVRAIISIIEGGEATVNVTLPEDMKKHVLSDSISLNDKQISSLENISITGPSVLRFDVVPMNDHDGTTQNIVVRVTKDSKNVGGASYGFVPTEFDVNAPSHTSTSAVTITGKAYPGYTVTVTDKSNNSVSTTVNELGYYSLQFTALVEGANALDVYFGGKYMKSLTVNYEEPQVEIQSLTIRNNVHNSYGETVEESVTITYPAGTPGRNFYTYWPGQDIFRFQVSLENGEYVRELWVGVTDYDGRTVRINLDTARPGFYEGEYLNEDPDCPPVGFEVHWLQIVNIQEPDETEEHHAVRTDVVPIMDPSGFVYEDVESNRVEGATVTVEYGGTGAVAEYVEDWKAEDFGQVNGYLTNVNGEFKWDVPKGWWRVRVEKDGYEDTYSDWMQVPPPQLGVTIDIGPNRKAENKTALYETVQITNDGYRATISFTQPVLFHQVEKALVITNDNNEPISGDLTVGKVLNRDNNGIMVKQVVFSADEPMDYANVRFSESAGSQFNQEVQARGSYQSLSIGALVKQETAVTVMLNYGSRSAGMDRLIVASYTADGQFLGMAATNAVNGKNEVACEDGTDFVKAFVVDSMDTMTPVCEAVSSK